MADAKDDGVVAEAQIAQPLGRWPILSYGVGHMLNDITSACWFTYLLLFLQQIGLAPRDAAIVMLSGQVADGLMTVLAGEMIDRFGRFKLWHIGGSVLVGVSFSSVFGGCLLCTILGTDSYLVRTVGYSIFAAVFNIGWAATQVSHMSMVNCMTLNPTSRVALASCRNAFTMVANLGLYAIALAVFAVIKAKECSDIVLQVREAKACSYRPEKHKQMFLVTNLHLHFLTLRYRWIAYLSIFIGCCFLVVFHIGTKEPTLKSESNCKKKARISWGYWFRKTLYYQVALLHMLARLITNVSQSPIAFYVTRDLRMNEYSKGIIPAIIFCCSFVVSIVLQEIKWNSRRLKSLLTVGATLWVISGVAVFVLPSQMHNLMYPLAMVIGAANALVMVTTVGLESALVGEDLNGCAFVYGSLSFLDKISCGIALFVLESYEGSVEISKNRTQLSCGETRGLNTVSRYGTGLIPSCFAVLSLVVTSTLRLQDAAPRAAALEAPLLV
ncbi:major facilitator superfamily domain-containing protein 12-like [Panicum miliaceum]|uniref:Major facilitator superfamily domain-containing protein 12-like n=1 Tax=Panicum miliaceum TaxID=4540 RepID=A0A3L6SAD0_PANMI|nr:major facilitator superfamily domain-containing protein 12-like [Panicum miliaceum]